MTYVFDSLDVAVEGGVAIVTLDHPPLNILDAVLLTDLDGFAARVRDDPEVRVIVFQSADPDFFIPHGDMGFIDDPEVFAGLKVGASEDPELNPMQRVFERVRRLPQVKIGKLRGYARGGGAEFLSALDMRFASLERAGLAQMEVLTGIIPGSGATVYLPPLLGRARTLEVILGAALFDAATAERYGWINRALPDAELDGFVTSLAARIGRLAPGVADAAVAAVDAGRISPLEALKVQNTLLGETFARPAAATLTRAAVAAGAQTREGERDLERLLNGLSAE
ncbi:enoyl-CoA hydratase/isomerase family protein [soil metagenome]